jgi:hypothetical protein
MPRIQKLQALIKGQKWREVNRVADELLDLMKGDRPEEKR